MSDKVAQWLDGLALSEYAELFAGQKIVFDDLVELNELDLKELGIPLGPRKRILKAAIALTGALHASPAAQPNPIEPDKPLAAWERHPGERKPVTMLFADITGSTAMTETLDAEEAHKLLYGAIQRMCETVENNHGTVCKLMGDGLMAMFGAPMASEHHAVEACEAALEMQQSIRDYATEGDAQTLSIRVGLHSGEVVVLNVGEGDKVEYDASGPTVHIAARMEQVAEPGEIFLSAATQLLAAQRIETDTLAPIPVKGISAPMPVYSLRRVRSVDEMIVDITRTPFVGRRAERNQFSGMLNTCIEEGLGQTIYIRGEPGIGKTRLLEEFTRIASEKGAQCYRGTVLPFGVGKGRDAIRSLVKSLLGIAPANTRNALSLAAETTLSEGRIDIDQAAFLYDLLDLPQPSAQKAIYDAMDNATRNLGKRAVVSKLVTAISKQQPAVVIVEDIHWADSLTLEHLSALTKTVAGCPAQFVMTSRIEGDQLDQSWRSTTEGSPFVSIDLGPLRMQDSLTMVREFISTNDDFVTNCVDRAAGNPLFLEQLLRNSQEGTTNNLPDSIQSLVLARMDRLDTKEKHALQAASIIGQRFDVEILHNLLDTKEYDCHELVAHNLVRPDADGFLFTHALIQESIYSSLVKSKRSELHRKAAQCFAESDLALHAEHLEHAGDDNAPTAFLAAAREQAEHYRLETASKLVRRGLAIASNDKERFALQSLQGELLRDLGSTQESIEVYRSAKETASSDIERCHASVGLAQGLRIIEAHDELLEELDFAESLASKHDLSLELALVNQLRGGVYFLRGETEACIEASQAALAYAEAAGSLKTTAQILSGLGDAEYIRGRMISANRYFDRCVKISREHGFNKILAANISMRGLGYYYQNKVAPAMSDFEQAISLSQETGQSRAEMIALACVVLMAERGDLDETARLAKRGLELARRLGAKYFIGEALVDLGRIEFMRGQWDSAERLAQEGVETLRDGGMAYMGPTALGMLALVTRDANLRRAALSEAEELLRGDSVSHNFLNFYPAAMETCLMNEQWDEVDRYAKALEEYTAAEPLPLTDFYIARGRALATKGRGSCDVATIQNLQRLRDEAERIGLKFAMPRLEEALSSS
jgi:class 3 adenylate cyclase/tetratricopeptide (TPR) repeat protein